MEPLQIMFALFLSGVSATLAWFWGRRNLDSTTQKLHSLESEMKNLVTDKKALQQAKEDVEVQKRLIEGKLPVERRHIVLMDGMTSAGKTCYVSRWSDPTRSFGEIEKELKATSAHYPTRDVPLCWSDQEKTELHTFRFVDISGENYESFIDAQLELYEESQKTESQGHVPEDVVVLLFWDLSKSFEENRFYMNEPRIAGTYRNKMALSLIKSVVVFLNKVDILSDRDAAKTRIKSDEQSLRQLFSKYTSIGPQNIFFVAGSVRSGAGVHDCHGKILTAFGLSGFYKDLKEGNPFMASGMYSADTDTHPVARGG